PAQDSAAACARAEELYKEGVALSDGSIREEFAYQKAIEACPSHAESRNALGVVYVIQKKWGMAESEFRRATEVKPDFAKAWFNLGSLYEQSGEFTRAIDAFLAAIDADKSYVKSYPRLAGLYLRFGNEEAAIQHYERMLQVGDDADAHYQLGVLYWKKGDKPRAGGHIQQAVKLNPDLLNKPEAGRIISAAF
ncbi:MAG: tetratricopeptide repeat protein, partial [Candidatus Methylomirabilis sp.]|nr:tetratricopeptide repeat protein [Deltaproteobacteria bacterium]